MHQVRPDYRECLVYQGRREKVDMWVQWVPRDNMDREGHKVPLVERAMLDYPVELVSLDLLERRVRMEKQGTRGLLVNLVLLVLKAKLGRRATLVLPERQDPQDPEEHQARMGPKAT